MLINPWFLNGGDVQERPIKFQEKEEEKQAHTSLPIQSDLAKFLQQKETAKKQILEIAEEVAKFIGEHKNKFNKISNSQWGAIRSICKEVAVSDKVLNDKGDEIGNQTTAEKNKNIAGQISKFMCNGVRSANWDCKKEGDKIVLLEGGCGDILLKAIEYKEKDNEQPLKFALLLSMQMPKIKGEKE